MAKTDVEKMVDAIRGVIAEWAHLPEKEVYEALVGEAEGWEMRLAELEDDE